MSYHSTVRTEVSPEMCPIIDHAIKQIEEAIRIADKSNANDSQEELLDKSTDISDALSRRMSVYNRYSGITNHSNVIDVLEEIRTSNEKLRQALCESMETNEELENTVSQQETTIAELREQVKELQSEKRVLEDSLYKLTP